MNRTVRVYYHDYRVQLDEDFDGGFAIFVNGELLADVETMPTDEDLVKLIKENVDMQTTIKTSFAQTGTFA